MRNASKYTAQLIIILMLTAGCSSDRVTVVGKLTKGGRPLPGQVLMVFVPLTDEKGPPKNLYNANVRNDGSYTVPGKTGQGIPIGKYRVAMTVLEQPTVLGDAFNKENSPIIRNVTGERSTQTIDIELDRPTEETP